MTTFNRLCLSIILGTIALAILLALSVMAYRIFMGYRTVHVMRNTTCAEYIAVSQGKNDAAKASYRKYINNADDDYTKLFDTALARSQTSFRSFVSNCLKDPKQNIREAYVGYSDASVYEIISNTIAEENTRLHADEETAERRMRLNEGSNLLTSPSSPNIITPTPQAQ